MGDFLTLDVSRQIAIKKKYNRQSNNKSSGRDKSESATRDRRNLKNYCHQQWMTSLQPPPSTPYSPPSDNDQQQQKIHPCYLKDKNHCNAGYLKCHLFGRVLKVITFMEDLSDWRRIVKVPEEQKSLLGSSYFLRSNKNISNIPLIQPFLKMINGMYFRLYI